jgi:ferredoxin
VTRAADRETFDLVLDLRAQHGLHPARARPRAICAGTGATWHALLKLRELVGEFEKPKFFVYKQKLCAHSRNERVGCNACVDICSAEAIPAKRAASRSRSTPTCAWAAAPARRCARPAR